MQMKTTQATVLVLSIFATMSSPLAQVKPVETIAREIRDATLTPLAQRPLPLAASFLTGEPNRSGYATPSYQHGPDGWLKRGYHFLPTFLMPGPDLDASAWLKPPQLGDDYYQAGMLEAARLGMPLVFYSTQWDMLLLNQPSVDGKQDALWKSINGTNYLMPGSLREAEWYEAGRKWATSAQMRRLMALYQNPPKVVFISNNEQQRLDWGNQWGDPRVVERDPACKAAVATSNGDLSENGPARNCLRRLFGDNWKRLYGRMLAGFRDGMRGTTWERVIQLVGYDAFGPLNVGRGSNWMDYSLTVMGPNGTVERWDPWSEVWDGGIVSLTPTISCRF